MKLDNITIGIKTLVIVALFTITTTFTVVNTFAFQSDLVMLEQIHIIDIKKYNRDKLWSQYIDLRALPNKTIDDEKRILELELQIKAIEGEINSLNKSVSPSN